jgi:hypothetical protein
MAGKPNIGWFNISAYNDGTMGYRTPKIDRLAKEGATVTDPHARMRSSKRTADAANFAEDTASRARLSCESLSVFPVPT